MSLKKIFIVLGMHRSGTSALARSLQVMDIHLGDHLMPPIPSENARGFWEDMDIYDLNIALLKQLGMDWDSPWELTEEEFQELMSSTLMKRAIDLIKSKIAPHDLFGIKDPRISVLLPFWDKVFASCGLETQYILAIRNPANVAMSLKKRNQIKEEEGYILWLRYNLLALKYFDGKKNNIHVIQYESLLKSPKECIAKLSLDLNLKINTQKLDEYISGFIDPSLEHHHLSIEELKNTKRAPQFLKTLYGELVQLSNQNQDAYEQFFNDNRMQWNKELENLSPFFKALKNIHSKANVESKKYLEKINQLDDEILAKDSEIALLDKEIVRRGEWGLNLDKAILERDGKITNLNAAIKKQESEVSQLNQVILERDGKITNLNHEISSRDKWSLNLDKELIKLNHEVWKRGEWGLSLNRKIDGLNEEVERRGIRVLSLESENEEKQKTLDDIVNSLYWKMTSPLRWLVKIIRSPKVYAKSFAMTLLKCGFYLFSRLPINLKNKLLIKSFILRYLPNLKLIKNKDFQSPPAIDSSIRSNKQIEIEKINPDSCQEILKKISLPFFKKPLISIIIPIYGKINYTLNCLSSISKNLPNTSFEIIVINDNSPDDSLKTLRKIKNLRILNNKLNQGFIFSCNKGAEASVGKYLYFLNNDTEVTPGWLDNLLQTFINFPKTGLVGSKLIYPDGTLQEAGCIIWKDGSAWNFGRHKDPNLPIYNYAREVDYCSGASILVPKSIFNNLGGFDMDYAPAYCEDSDLCLKIRNKGLRVIYQPLSQIIHYEGITSGIDILEGTKSYQVINMKKQFERWSHILSQYQENGIDVDSAKDRRASKRVLYLDLCTPTPDKDSGSIDAMNHMLLLREMNFQVTFIPVDNIAYVIPYTINLQRNGIEVLYYPYIKSVEEHLESMGTRYDLVIFSRVETAQRFMKAVKDFCIKAKTIFITVDLHFLRLERTAILEKSKKIAMMAKEIKEQELYIMQRMDISTVISTYEYDLLKKLIPKNKLRLLPYTREVNKKISSFEARKNIVFVGSFQHPPNIDAVKFFVLEVMPYIRKLMPSLKFYIVGSHMVDEIKALEAPDIVIQGFVQDLSQFLSEFKLSVVPLRVGAGIKGKIGTSLSLGLPVISTPIGAEGMELKNKENVIIEEKPKAFAEKLVTTYKDKKLWDKLSKNGLDYAEKNWGANKGYENLASILKDLDLPIKAKSYPLTLYSD